MPKPKECPKCKSEEVTNAFDTLELFGENKIDYKKWFCANCDYNFGDDEAVPWFNGLDFSKMTLGQIADVVFADWSDIDPYALQYLEAMMNLNNINDRYGSDDAVSVISYFLSNAKKWQGATARKVKTHLNNLVDDYNKSRKS